MKETRNMLKKSKQTVVFASQIHKEREGGSVNTYTIVHRTQEAFDRTSPGRALLRVIPTETNPQFGTDGTRRLGGRFRSALSEVV